MASVTEHGVELNERGRIHDASKFGPAERIPYIWLTEFHRCRNEGAPFTYPDGMVDLVRAAINHHTTTNRHHAEIHADPNDMTEVDLIEMVCDWTAMSEEFGQDGGSARRAMHPAEFGNLANRTTLWKSQKPVGGKRTLAQRMGFAMDTVAVGRC